MQGLGWARQDEVEGAGTQVASVGPNSKLSQALQQHSAEGQEEMGINWNKTGHTATLFPCSRLPKYVVGSPSSEGFLDNGLKKDLRNLVKSQSWLCFKQDIGLDPFLRFLQTWIRLSTYKNGCVCQNTLKETIKTSRNLFSIQVTCKVHWVFCDILVSKSYFIYTSWN